MTYWPCWSEAVGLHPVVSRFEVYRDLLAVIFMRVCLDLIFHFVPMIAERWTHTEVSWKAGAHSLSTALGAYLTAGILASRPLRETSFQKLSASYLTHQVWSPTFSFLKEKGDTFLKIIVLCCWTGFPEINSRNTVLYILLRSLPIIKTYWLLDTVSKPSFLPELNKSFIFLTVQ